MENKQTKRGFVQRKDSNMKDQSIKQGFAYREDNSIKNQSIKQSFAHHKGSNTIAQATKQSFMKHKDNHITARPIKRGFALEGGGAKGSYHMGVCKAYIESGYEFHGVVGTSIGAINAVMIASGEFDKALELWETVGVEHLFDQEFLDILKLDQGFTGNVTTALKKLVTDRGVDHSRIKEFLASYIDEEKVRASGIDFGLVTFSLSERKPYEIFLKDIPDGKLVDYILASAKLPIFTPLHLDDNRFIDGGITNSCPINMLIDQGYDEIVAIRTKSFGVFRRYDKNANVIVIETDEHLGHVLEFSANNAKLNIKRGYCDGLRAIQKLTGHHYYLRDASLQLVVQKLFNITEDDLEAVSYFSREIGEKKRILFERVIPDIGEYLRLDKNFTYKELVLEMLEFVALRKEIERFEVYDFDDFCDLVKNTPTPKSDNLLSKVGFDFSEKRSILVEEIAKLLI